MIIQVKAVMFAQAVVQIGPCDGQRTFIVAYVRLIASDFVALAHDVASVPIIFPIGRIDRNGMVPCVRQSRFQCQAFGYEVLFVITCRNVPCIRIAFGHTIDFGLYGTGLQFLVRF